MIRRWLGVLAAAIFLALIAVSVQQQEPTIAVWATFGVVGAALILLVYPKEWPKGKYGAGPLYNWRGALIQLGTMMTTLGFANATLIWRRGHMNWPITFTLIGVYLGGFAFGFVLDRLKEK
ncbi:MAG TPA: hypothetical protein VF707_10585 [Ardenticatenaceae bacterium]|jgi:hypothetical protein